MNSLKRFLRKPEKTVGLRLSQLTRSASAAHHTSRYDPSAVDVDVDVFHHDFGRRFSTSDQNRIPENYQIFEEIQEEEKDKNKESLEDKLKRFKKLQKEAIEKKFEMPTSEEEYNEWVGKWSAMERDMDTLQGEIEKMIGL